MYCCKIEVLTFEQEKTKILMKMSEGPPSNRNTPTTDAKKSEKKAIFFGGDPGLIFTQRIS